MLELKELTLQIEGSREIVDHINLTLQDGKFTAITGPNGGGKSTLAKLIAGVDRPTSGQILFNGEDITGLSITERARKGIGFAFQQPVRFKGLTVRDLLELAAGEPASETQLMEYLCAVGLCAKDYLSREINASLSGGEMKRIEIATAIARKAAFTIFDEPEAGIDLWSFSSLIDVFSNFRQEWAGGLVVISHQERILNIADEIVVLSGGRISAQGSREELLPGLLGQSEDCRTCMNGEAHRVSYPGGKGRSFI